MKSALGRVVGCFSLRVDPVNRSMLCQIRALDEPPVRSTLYLTCFVHKLHDNTALYILFSLNLGSAVQIAEQNLVLKKKGVRDC